MEKVYVLLTNEHGHDPYTPVAFKDRALAETSQRFNAETDLIFATAKEMCDSYPAIELVGVHRALVGQVDRFASPIEVARAVFDWTATRAKGLGMSETTAAVVAPKSSKGKKKNVPEKTPVDSGKWPDNWQIEATGIEPLQYKAGTTRRLILDTILGCQTIGDARKEIKTYRGAEADIQLAVQRGMIRVVKPIAE